MSGFGEPERAKLDMNDRLGQLARGFFGSTCLLMGCSGVQKQAESSAWFSEVVDVHLKISSHLLRLEVSRDSLKLDEGVFGQTCDPRLSQDVYASVNSTLSRAIETGASSGIERPLVEKVRAIETEWLSLARRQQSAWDESQAGDEMPPADRCLRPTDLVSTRLSVERNFADILKSGVRRP